MAPAYKVTYFDLKALGEPIRLILAYGNVEFEDVRITHEEWPKLKPSTPLGQMPILEFDGKTFHQSQPICRYLASKFGVAGKNDLENLEIDIAVATIDDVRAKAAVAHYDPDETVKATKRAEFQKDFFPTYLAKLESDVKKNNGYMACGRLTWADLHYAGVVDYVSEMVGFTIGEKYPALEKLKETVLAIPQIKAYYEKAPETLF